MEKFYHKGPKRICVLTDAWRPVWGGGQEHIWQIYTRLAQQGYQIDIVTPNLLPLTTEKTPENIKIVKVGKPFPFPNLIGRLIFIVATLWYTLTTPYELYHSHSPSTSICLVPLTLLRKKTATTIHGKAQKGLGAGLINNLDPVIRLLSDFFVYTVSYDILFTAATSTIERNPAAKQVIATGNGVNIDNYDKLRVTKGAAGTRFLWVGRFDPVKAVNLLVEAFSLVEKKHPLITLVLVGDGTEKKAVEQQVKSLKLTKKVGFKGYLFGNNLIREYKRSDVFVLPSLSEGFPLVVVEAFAANLPVLATKVGDMPLLINKSQGGLLIAPGNVAALSQAMDTMLRKKGNGIKMGKNGHDYVQKHYSWGGIATKVAEAYQQLS